MLDESIQLIRSPTEAERRLLTALVSKADRLTLPIGWLETLEVQQMDDNGMGSLRLLFSAASIAKRAFGRQASELIFEDTDGVKVVASLYLDVSGMPMELDLWKTDFNPLICIPTDFERKRLQHLSKDRGNERKDRCLLNWCNQRRGY